MKITKTGRTIFFPKQPSNVSIRTVSMSASFYHLRSVKNFLNNVNLQICGDQDSLLLAKGTETFIRQLESENTYRIEDNGHLFLRRIYGDGLQTYVNCLKAFGFTGEPKVLNAGSGYGQWSLALAGLNKAVEFSIELL